MVRKACSAAREGKKEGGPFDPALEAFPAVRDAMPAGREHSHQLQLCLSPVGQVELHQLGTITQEAFSSLKYPLSGQCPGLAFQPARLSNPLQNPCCFCPQQQQMPETGVWTEEMEHSF